MAYKHGNQIYAGFTTTIFQRSIQRAKAICLDELGVVMQMTGIYQTRQFWTPELYREYVDTAFVLVWYCLYREVIEAECQCNGMTHGKLTAILRSLKFPSRIIDVAFHTLSPVLLGSKIFMPALSLVKCTKHTCIDEQALFFGTRVGPITELGRRFGIPIRASFPFVTQSMVGAMTGLTALTMSEVHPVLRVIEFLKSTVEFNNDEDDTHDHTTHDDYEEIDGELNEFNVDETAGVVQETEDWEGPNWHNKMKNFVEANFPDSVVDEDTMLNETKWFVPYVYHRLTGEYDFSYVLATELALVIETPDDIEKRGIRRTTCISTLDEEGTYYGFLRDLNPTNFSAVILASLKDLRVREGQISPRWYNRRELVTTIRDELTRSWRDTEYPSLDDPGMIIQPLWQLPCDSPFFPYTIKWTRNIRATQMNSKPTSKNMKDKLKGNKKPNVNGKPEKPPDNTEQVQTNIHETKNT